MARQAPLEGNAGLTGRGATKGGDHPSPWPSALLTQGEGSQGSTESHPTVDECCGSTPAGALWRGKLRLSRLAGRLILASRLQLLPIVIFQDNCCRCPMIC